MQHNKPQGFPEVTESGNTPTILDVWRLVTEIRDRLEKVERQQEEHVTAFSINDLNKPDFDGHRKSHAKLVKSEEIMDSYKKDATKEIISIAVIFLFGLFSTGIYHKALEIFK